MAERFWTSRRRKIGLISLAVAGLIISTLIFSINDILSPIIARKMRNVVTQSSDSLYQVSFRHVALNIFTGRLALSGIKLSPDPIRSRSATEVHSGSAKTLLITGLHPLAYLFHKRLEIGSVTLTHPNIVLTVLKAPKKQLPNQAPLYKRLLGNLRLIQANGILVSNARLKYIDHSKPKSSAYNLKELNLNASDLQIDSMAQRDSLRTFFCRDITAGIRGFTGFTDGGLYQYNLRAAHFSTRSEKLIVRGIVVKPLPAGSFFAKSKADRFRFDLDSLELNHFDYRRFISDHLLKVKRLKAFNGGISVSVIQTLFCRQMTG